MTPGSRRWRSRSPDLEQGGRRPHKAVGIGMRGLQTPGPWLHPLAVMPSKAPVALIWKPQTSRKCTWMRCLCWSLGLNHPRLSTRVPVTLMFTQPQLSSLHGSWHKHRSPKTGILAASRYTREVSVAQVAHTITAEFVLSEVPIAQSLGNSRCPSGVLFPEKKPSPGSQKPREGSSAGNLL